MDYELKHTNPAIVTTDVNGSGNSKVTISFITGVVGCPYNMTITDMIVVPILNAGPKTQDEINIEVMKAVYTFIATKYPST